MELGPAPESMLQGALFCLSPFLLWLKPTKTANTENSGGTELNPQGTFPSADNSILPEFEFHTGNFIARSTPKKDRFLKPEPTLSGDVESRSQYLPSVAMHTEEWEPVPSSRSPSPMVLRKSPSKEEEREQRAHQVITESITTLLGKRQASKEEVVTAAQNGRVAKRSRPLSRTKVGGLSLFSGGEIYTTCNSRRIRKKNGPLKKQMAIRSYLALRKTGWPSVPSCLSPASKVRTVMLLWIRAKMMVHVSHTRIHGRGKRSRG